MASLRISQVNKLESNERVAKRYCLCPGTNNERLWVYEILLDDEKIGWASFKMRSDSDWEEHEPYWILTKLTKCGTLQRCARISWYSDDSAGNMVVILVNTIMEELRQHGIRVNHWSYGTRDSRPESPTIAPPAADLARWKTAILV